MSEVNKERRLRMLDVAMYNGEAVKLKNFKKFLLDVYQYEVELRTLQRDIEELKLLLADRNMDDETEILYKEKGAYKYLKGYFAFEETNRVKATELGKVLKYNEEFLTNMDAELERQINALIKEYDSEENSKISWHPVVYQNKIYEGNEKFGDVLKFINQQIPVEITHQRLGQAPSKPKKYLFLLLKALDNNFAKGWYVLAQKLEDGVREIELDIDNFNLIALDRIVKTRPLTLKLKTTYKKGFNPNKYFEHSVKGILRKNLNKKKREHEQLSKEECHKLGIYSAPEKVSLVIPDKNNWICNYFEKYPIHTSQLHRFGEKSFYIDLFVEVDMDLENLIYMYSKEIKVLKPLYLRNVIRERLENALENY